VQLYADRVGDEWTDLVLGIHHLCRTRLNYGLPTSKAERSELRELCAKVLPFENHVLGEFARGGGEKSRRRRAAEEWLERAQRLHVLGHLGPGGIRVNARVLTVDALTAAEHRHWDEASA
jgi:hypothetical protein